MGLMRLIKCFLLCLLANLALVALARPVADGDHEWYLEEVVHDVFVVQNDFEYYYQPSAADVSQQRAKGEVTYFLNTPTGLNSKKVKALIDRLMGSYDDIKAVGDWHMTTGTYWKEFRHERNKFRFNVKRKALDDGTYYVSVTESSNYYKSLGKGKASATKATSKNESPKKSSTRKGRRPVIDEDVSDGTFDEIAPVQLDGEDVQEPVVSEKQRRQEAREKKQAEADAERARMRRAQEQRREEARAQKEAEKLKKEEEKKA